MKHTFLGLLLATICLPLMAQNPDTIGVTTSVERVGNIRYVTTVTTICDDETVPAWYHPERLYYDETPKKYTIGDFFDAIDLPTVFGLGFNPTGNEEGVGYYSQMFLEWRRHKTYGYFIAAGLDSHDQSYSNLYQLADPNWTPGLGAFSFGDADYSNIAGGTVYNMELVVGGGYRLPLVKNLQEFYLHPYVNDWNISASAQFGYAWSTLKHITPCESFQPDPSLPNMYDETDVNYIHPVMKFDVAVEWFTSPKFSIFAMASYMQHLTTLPWDNPQTHAGTLAFSIGFSGFFN